LAQSLLPNEKKRNIKMEIQMILNKSYESKISNNEDQIKIKLLGGPNKNIPALSKFVKIKYSESMGRCLVVSSDIKPGNN